MEIDYFVPKESSSGEIYYVDKTTGKAQWGSKKWGSKRLPKEWVRLNYNGKHVYKYIGNKIPLTSSLVHSPKSTIEPKRKYPASTRTVQVPEEMLLMMPRREPATRTAITTYSTIEPIRGAVPFTEAKKKFKVGQRIPMTPEAKRALDLDVIKIFAMSFEDLDEEDEKQKAEAYRRRNLFKQVAKLLNLRTDSIWDESLQFHAKKADILPQTIIDFIEQTERKQFGEYAVFTPFSTIRRTVGSFSSESSIRELCGVNMREAEASKAMAEIEEELSCHIRSAIFKDPVTCSSGHTFERAAIEIWLQTNRTCPTTRKPITTYIVPNFALRNVLEKFVEKYEHQRGDIWKPIVQACLEYKDFSGRLKEPKDVYVPESDSDGELVDPEIQFRDIRDRERELEREREENQTERTADQIRDFMNNYFADLNIMHADDIPEIVAQSDNSSYANAIRHYMIRYNEGGRTAEQIRAYMTNQGADDYHIQDIPEFIAGSTDSSYRHANEEANRRREQELRELREFDRTGRSAREIRDYIISQNIDVDDEDIDDIAETIAQSGHSSYSQIVDEINRRYH